MRTTRAQRRERIWKQRMAHAATPEAELDIAFNYFRSAIRHLKRRRFRGVSERVTRLATAARLEREAAEWFEDKAEEIDLRMREAGYDDTE
jgi:hypothetical protein